MVCPVVVGCDRVNLGVVGCFQMWSIGMVRYFLVDLARCSRFSLSCVRCVLSWFGPVVSCWVWFQIIFC